MMHSIATQGLVILVGFTFVSANAAVVHKWVDADGVTHYSDEAPDEATTQMIELDVSEAGSASTSVEPGYYSIANQWARMHKESLERERLRLEHSRQQAARKPPVPQVVYVNEPDKRYVYAIPGRYHYHHKRKHYYKKSKYYSGYKRKKHYRGSSPPGLHAGRLKLGSFRTLQ